MGALSGVRVGASGTIGETPIELAGETPGRDAEQIQARMILDLFRLHNEANFTPMCKCKE